MSKPISNLKKFREDKFMTLAELSKKSTVAIGTISNAERGQRISLGSIKKLAAALGVKPEKLL